jgi:hypothetical protein
VAVEVEGEIAAGALVARAAGLPHVPGVYRFRDGAGGVLYVGASGDLGRRVASYFAPHHERHRKAARIARLAARVEWRATPTVLEALVLEARTIQRERPHFNRLLKDSGRHLYVRFDERDPFPRLEVTRRLESGTWRYLGPFPGGRRVSATLERLADALGLRTCAGRLNPDPDGRACLRMDLRQCTVPCLARVTPGAYGRQLACALVALGGGEPEVARALGARAGTSPTPFPPPMAAALRTLRARRLWAAVIVALPASGEPGYRLLAVGGGQLRCAVGAASSAALPEAFSRVASALDPPPPALLARDALDEARVVTGWLASTANRASAVDLGRLGREGAWAEVARRTSPGPLWRAIRD